MITQIFDMKLSNPDPINSKGRIYKKGVTKLSTQLQLNSLDPSPIFNFLNSGMRYCHLLVVLKHDKNLKLFATLIFSNLTHGSFLTHSKVYIFRPTSRAPFVMAIRAKIFLDIHRAKPVHIDFRAISCFSKQPNFFKVTILIIMEAICSSYYLHLYLE